MAVEAALALDSGISPHSVLLTVFGAAKSHA
jgi:hypothetical protein